MGIVVPEASYLLEYCKNANIPGDFKELCQNKVNKNTFCLKKTSSFVETKMCFFVYRE